MERFIEKTVVLVKHDGVQRGLVGEFIKRFEQKGLKIAAMKFIHPGEEIADKHYVMTDAWIEKLGNNTRNSAKEKGIELKETNEQIASRVRDWNKSYLMEGPVVAILFEGPNAIEIGRKIVGPAECKQAPIGTIRGDYSTESYEMADTFQRTMRSIVHASGNKEEAMHELKLWFNDEEIYDYELHLWKVIHR